MKENTHKTPNFTNDELLCYFQLFSGVIPSSKPPPTSLPPPPTLNGGRSNALNQPYVPSHLPNGRVSSFLKPQISASQSLSNSNHMLINSLLPPPSSGLMQHPFSMPSAGATPGPQDDKVESILARMRPLVEPLDAISATPRNEIAEIQPVRQHKYALLPPMFNASLPPTINNKSLTRK